MFENDMSCAGSRPGGVWAVSGHQWLARDDWLLTPIVAAVKGVGAGGGGASGRYSGA
jgi:hypothetical protein